MDDFEAWWHHEAIFIDKGMFEDNMEFAKRLCEIAWQTSAETCAQLCEDHFSSDGDWCATQIRAREQ